MKLGTLALLLFTTEALALTAGRRARTGTSSFSRVARSTEEEAEEYGALTFNNVGYEGTYYNVESINVDKCECKLNTESPFSFEGPNSPLDEELSVHLRGPLRLKQFAYYLFGNETNDDATWERLAYYNSETQAAENVTFMGNVGENSTCLGQALDYVGTDGISSATSSQVLEADNELYSDEEIIIYSNVTCESSGWSKDCGVYRKGIPAFHGFSGTTKMFLFEFETPEESKYSEDDVLYYDMPAIWLLNARIPRTSQYPTNTSCSCWASGCGEFDIFEVMNSTDSNKFVSTIHDFQGTDEVQTGLTMNGYMLRTPEETQSGGVVFGSDGTITVFLSNYTDFSSQIEASVQQSWIFDLEEDTLATTLSSASSGLYSSSSEGAAVLVGSSNNWITLSMVALLPWIM
ncbi:BA75_02155T0 [Komagataella pastoris]|uniref:glucan endo-1,3-beta-D-glucosidase n=1 Tax=Komagataella pastoris TaxID=4922 RepID=A0A1B2JB56_PICPA|nr:BA75_02155T0 [Komagataella pastoris]